MNGGAAAIGGGAARGSSIELMDFGPGKETGGGGGASVSVEIF